MPRLLLTLFSLYLLQSSVCAKIVQLLGQNEVDHHQKQVVILSQDSFYRILTTEQKAKALKGQFNFDHPGDFLLRLGRKGCSETHFSLLLSILARVNRLKCH